MNDITCLCYTSLLNWGRLAWTTLALEACIRKNGFQARVIKCFAKSDVYDQLIW